MKKIKLLVEDINEELEAAEHYAKKATEYKDDDRELADVYAKKSSDELGHVDAFHGQVVRIIKEWKTKSGEEPPAAMTAVWDYEHQRSIDKAAKIRALLDMYRGA